MNFLSMNCVQDLFLNLAYDSLQGELQSINDYLLTVATAKEIDALIAAIRSEDLDQFIGAMQAACEHGITLHSRIDVDDVDLDESEDLHNLVEALEIMKIYEILEDNNHSGMGIDSIAFINANYFETYAKDEAIDNSWVSDHVVDCVNWSDYADKMKVQYKSVMVECPNLLKANSLEFYYPA